MKNNKIISYISHFIKKFIKNFNKEKIILISIFSIFWYYFIHSVELDTISSYFQYVLKGLILAMINIAIIYNNISIKKLIFYCIMPFFTSLLILYKYDITFIFIPYSIMLLIDYFKIFFILKKDFIFKSIWPLNTFNIKDFLSKIKNLITLIYEEYMVHTLGGSPEECKKTFFKPDNANVNYTKSSGEPSGGRATSPAGSETSDLYGSDKSTKGNSPQATGGTLTSNTPVNTPINRSAPTNPKPIGSYNVMPPPITNNTIRSVGNSRWAPYSRPAPVQSTTVVPVRSTQFAPVQSTRINLPTPVPTGLVAPLRYNTISNVRPIASNIIPIASSPFTNTSVTPSSPIQLPPIDNRAIGSTNSGVAGVSNTNATIADQIVPYTRDSRTLDFVYKKNSPYIIYGAINEAFEIFNRNQPNFINVNQKLQRLDPIIGDLIEKFSNRNYKLTISDVAEAKYILSLSDQQQGLRLETAGLYNQSLLKKSNSITVELNTNKKYWRDYIATDLRVIKTRNISEDQ